MTYENMFPLPDYDGGPADRLRDARLAKENRKTDWVETEHRVIMEQETLAQYSNEITLEDIIRAGIQVLNATNRWHFEEEECTDAGF